MLTTLEGDVLWEAAAWMRLLEASTTLLEATIVHEAAWAVVDSVGGKEAKPEILRFANNQATVIRLRHRPIATACADLLQRVEAAEELHAPSARGQRSMIRHSGCCIPGKLPSRCSE